MKWSTIRQFDKKKSEIFLTEQIENQNLLSEKKIFQYLGCILIL